MPKSWQKYKKVDKNIKKLTFSTTFCIICREIQSTY